MCVCVCVCVFTKVPSSERNATRRTAASRPILLARLTLLRHEEESRVQRFICLRLRTSNQALFAKDGEKQISFVVKNSGTFEFVF